MDNSIAWWNDRKVVKGLLSPFKESKSLGVALEFKFFITLFGVSSASKVDLNRVVDDEVNLT
jgi:hypothetical protein